nr:hypothetical protein Clen_27 [Cedratvirus lena]
MPFTLFLTMIWWAKPIYLMMRMEFAFYSLFQICAYAFLASTFQVNNILSTG